MGNPFIVCKASAGSGKTTTLVGEYLKMALARGEAGVDSDFRRILAITFTNKAAAEMKSRIMGELDRMAADKDNPMHQLAERLHSAILHHYSDLSVSTIDSFMHRIVRTFAHDLGQPLNFDVEIDQQRIIDDSVAELMSLAGTPDNEDLTAMLNAFADSRMEDGKDYNVEESIRKLAKQLFKEDVDVHLERLKDVTPADFRALYSQYAAKVREFESTASSLGAKLLSLLSQAGIGLENACYGKTGYWGYLTKLSEGVVAEPSKRTVEAFTNMQFVKKGQPQEGVEAVSGQLSAAFDELTGHFERQLTHYNTCRAIMRNLYSMGVLGVLNGVMKQLERENEVVHLSDFNRLINSVVRQDANAPFIFERLGNRYHHFLIDEFQDTSILQWHNLVPLVDNGVSAGHESFVVGDGKQAIYRFRQGDVRQFVRLPKVEGMPDGYVPTLSLKGNYSYHNLGNNYRTASSIVKFNNLFFSHLAREVYAHNPIVQQIYIGTDENGSLLPEGKELLVQKIMKEKEGRVEVEFVQGDRYKAVFQRIVDTVRSLVDEQGFRYSDIIILARGNAQLNAISDYLLANTAIPQTSAESFSLRSSEAVMAIVASLRLVVNAADRIAFADLHHRLVALGLRPESEHFITLQVADLLPNIEMLRSLDIYDCAEGIVRTLRLDGVDVAYVASLLNVVASFSASHRQSVSEFLEWFDEQGKLSVASSENVDAVRLLTIHKAKGLEAPVVICPLFAEGDKSIDIWVDLDAEGTTKGQRLPTAFVSLTDKTVTDFEPRRVEESLLSEVDELNVLYVALTRPREQLFVFCPQDDVKPGTLKFPTLLYDFVQKHPELLSHGKVAERTVDGSAGAGAATLSLDRLTFAPWESKVRIASPSERSTTKLLDPRVRFGIHAHDLLSTVRHADDAEDAIARFGADNGLDEDEMRPLAELVREVVANPSTAHFFDPSYEVKNEADMVMGGMSSRPDRIVVTPTETWVVDFKTGAPLPSHLGQVTSYCRIIARMGYPDVSGYLIYLQPEVRLVKV